MNLSSIPITPYSEMPMNLDWGFYNRGICVPGRGTMVPFTTLMVDRMPDLHVLPNPQCFPMFRYEMIGGVVQRFDNITDWSLRTWQDCYDNETIIKDDIFYYVYGVLHSQVYRDRYKNNLNKQIPRIPIVSKFKDFYDFSKAGRKLGDIHCEYETCDKYPLGIQPVSDDSTIDFRITKRPMKWVDRDKSILQINDSVRLTGFPPESHRYIVSGRSLVGWFVDQYRIKKDKYSGIENNPNGWFGKPEDIKSAIERVVFVSVETMRIVDSLPYPFDD